MCVACIVMSMSVCMSRVCAYVRRKVYGFPHMDVQWLKSPRRTPLLLSYRLYRHPLAFTLPFVCSFFFFSFFFFFLFLNIQYAGVMYYITKWCRWSSDKIEVIFETSACCNYKAKRSRWDQMVCREDMELWVNINALLFLYWKSTWVCREVGYWSSKTPAAPLVFFFLLWLMIC